MNFVQKILVGLLKSLSNNDQVLALTLEEVFPAEAPFIAATDALYQAELKNPGNLIGTSVPLTIKGIAMKITISAA